LSIKFRCATCGKQISAPDNLAGQRRSCPQCGTPLTIPVPPPQSSVLPTVVQTSSQEEPATDHPLLLIPRRPDHHEDLIDMTAMVDIVFFLLIFFLVTSIQSLEAVIDLPTPDAPSSSAGNVEPVNDPSHDPNYITVTIDQDDTVWVEDKDVYGEENLRARLRALKKEDPHRTGLLIIGDADASHGTFVMVLDAGADAGMKDLLFSAAENVARPGSEE
jgi:biopolymer transport protein ExbD